MAMDRPWFGLPLIQGELVLHTEYSTLHSLQSMEYGIKKKNKKKNKKDRVSKSDGK